MSSLAVKVVLIALTFTLICSINCNNDIRNMTINEFLSTVIERTDDTTTCIEYIYDINSEHYIVEASLKYLKSPLIIMEYKNFIKNNTKTFCNIYVFTYNDYIKNKKDYFEKIAQIKPFTKIIFFKLSPHKYFVIDDVQFVGNIAHEVLIIDGLPSNQAIFLVKISLLFLLINFMPVSFNIHIRCHP